MAQRSAREDWIQAFVRANFGLAFMPRSLADRAGLDHVRTADADIVREVCLLTPNERPISAAQRVVIDSIVGHEWPREPVLAQAA